MAGNNPRKFSEKIALHTQKQAEETRAFEQIMKEVMDATVPKPPPTKQPHLLPILNTAFRGGSLPNVNQMTQQGDKCSQPRPIFNSQQSTSPRASRNSIGPDRLSRTRISHHSPSPYASPPAMSMLSQSMTSNSANLSSGLVYGTNYLSPPMDPAWRRANSDSALNSLMIPSVVPDSSEESSNNSNDTRDNYGLMGRTNDSPNLLPIPNTVGDGPNLLEIPSAVNTGSLPDLTNFNQFTTPLQPPIDSLDEQLSPFSTSPLSLTYSPSLSPHPPLQSSQQASGQQQSQVQISQSPHSQQPQQMMDNPLHVNVNTPFQYSPNDNMLTAYRCPPRPSPQNSPSPFRSPSPLDGHLSAPSSPTAQPIQNSTESYYLSQQAQALQRHFEQISMVDPSPENGHGQWQGGGMASPPYFYNQPQQIPTAATAGVTTQHSPQHPQPQTPQTPSSIPDIIFTDLSEVRSNEPLEEFLASDAAAVLRESLGSIDVDGFQMLAEQGLVTLTDEAEDTFRQDRL